jgi:membrane-associated protease RseP (regulator of RpoE activity)
VALPLFVIGLLLAPIQHHASLYGDGLLPSTLIAIVERLRDLPPGHHLTLHPISFAAYIGLFITAVNLFPAGQLDGGHIAYALLGRRSNILAYATVLALLLLGVITDWASWYIWAALITFFGLRHPPTIDDGEKMDGFRTLLGISAFVILLLLFGANPFPVFR